VNKNIFHGGENTPLFSVRLIIVKMILMINSGMKNSNIYFKGLNFVFIWVD